MAREKYQQWLEPEGLLLLEGWARDGRTEAEIARSMGCSPSTLRTWRGDHPPIAAALERGRSADYAVENALLKRALGYEYVEERVETGEKGGQKVIQTTKLVPPDPAAQLFWLKNRRPDRWRDKPEAAGERPAAPAESMTLSEKLSAAQDLEAPLAPP